MGALQVAILAPQIGCTWVSPGLPHPKPPTFLRNFQIKFSGKSSGSPKFRRCLWRILLPCFGGCWPYWRSPWACGLKMWWRMSRCHATSVRRWCQPRCQSASTPGVMVFLFLGGGIFWATVLVGVCCCGFEENKPSGPFCFFNGAWAWSGWLLDHVGCLRWECSSVTSGLRLMCFVCQKMWFFGLRKRFKKQPGALRGDLSIHAFQPYVSNHQEVSLDANMRCGIFWM